MLQILLVFAELHAVHRQMLGSGIAEGTTKAARKAQDTLQVNLNSIDKSAQVATPRGMLLSTEMSAWHFFSEPVSAKPAPSCVPISCVTCNSICKSARGDCQHSLAKPLLFVHFLVEAFDSLDPILSLSVFPLGKWQSDEFGTS